MKNLFGKSQDDLEKIALDLDEKKFRGKQLYDWIYSKKASSLDDCSNLPKKFISKLREEGYEITLPEVIEVLTDPEDGTKKFLFKLTDGELVESVLMKYSFGNSVCLSTQVGCNMGCSFCASGKFGKTRDLTKEEIAGQIVAIEKNTNEKISNIVLMGMGEPLDNYDNVLAFIKLANKDLNIGQRHITLSTCGLVDKIYQLADENLQITLAISLHSPFQEKRAQVLPIAKRYNIDELIQASKDYVNKTGRRITFEYTLIDGFNNRLEDAKELKKILKNFQNHVNIIPLNSIDEEDSGNSNYVKLFSDLLNKEGITSTIRKKNGKNIDAACGQLRNRVLNEKW